MKNAIEVENLYFSYRNGLNQIDVLKNISFSVKPSEIVAIQGPSGSGKSTLLYLLGMLSRPTTGNVKINGVYLTDLSSSEAAHFRNKNIGFVFQQFHLLPKTNVLENILLPTHYATPKKSADYYISKAHHLALSVGLSQKLQQFPNQLSGGEQQRVAICRALILDPDIILADEPTGNLDSNSADQILQILLHLNREFKKTIIIISHDNMIAEHCDRIIKIKDGGLVNSSNNVQSIPTPKNEAAFKKNEIQEYSYYNLFISHFPTALQNMARNKTRTALTMLGILVGIAAVFAMITLGQYTEDKITSGYLDLGVNTVSFRGYPSWNQKATDIYPVPFKSFDWQRDLVVLKNVFPEIKKMSPMMKGWDASAFYGGRFFDQELIVFGTSEEALQITQQKFFLGRNFTLLEVEQKSAVCVIGYEIAKKLFFDTQPLGQALRVSIDVNTFGCRVIGVLAPGTSSRYGKANLQIYLPFTFFQAWAETWWAAEIKEVFIQFNSKADFIQSGKKIRAYFDHRYGKSGEFVVDSDNVLLVQMKKFLTLFSVLLFFIAFITLAVGGIGITNMMLVSVSERYREIGLRKALGATDPEIRAQFLVEAMTICGLAGIMGLVFGFIFYETAIWVTTQFLKNYQFEWIFNGVAFFISIISIILVGILSGIFPALRAEKLQVIEALRSE